MSRSCPPFAHPAGRRVYKEAPVNEDFCSLARKTRADKRAYIQHTRTVVGASLTKQRQKGHYQCFHKKGPSRAVRRLAYWRKRPVFPQSCRQKPVAVAAHAATAALHVMRGPQGKAGLPAWFPRSGLPVSSGAAWCEAHEPYGGGSAPALHGIPFSSRYSGYHCPHTLGGGWRAVNVELNPAGVVFQ